MIRILVLFILLQTARQANLLADESEFRLATFSADITIPLGHRCMGILETKAQRIADPLEARGFVLLSKDAPIVFVALDWCEVRNGAYDLWRDTLANAARTTRERVLICSLHQHDAPVIDTEAQEMLDSVGLVGELFDVAFHQDCLVRVSSELERSLLQAQPLTHVAIQQAKVERIASNRRVMHADGVVRYDRYSRSASDSPQAKADEGEIDSNLKSIHFLNGDKTLAVLSSYATHPMSYYGQGSVSADFVGLARRRRQIEAPDAFQIYASGCSGDVTAGKYNDGSEQARVLLAERLSQAMDQASQKLTPHRIKHVELRSQALQLPFHEGDAFRREAMTTVLHNEKASVRDRILAAMGLASLNRLERGQPIDLPCLDFGLAQVVLLPGESFVGYQLMAQQIQPESFVMAIGYGECWPGYIPTQKAFDEGFGHDWRWVGPGCEPILRRALNWIIR